MGIVRDRMLRDLRLRGLSENTRDSYVACARRFVEHHRRPPDEVGTEEILGFLDHLVTERGVSRSTLRVYAAALKFLYRYTLERPDIAASIPTPKVPQHRPVVLSGSEVDAIFGALRSPKYPTPRPEARATGCRWVGRHGTIRSWSSWLRGSSRWPRRRWRCAGTARTTTTMVWSIATTRTAPTSCSAVPRTARAAATTTETGWSIVPTPIAGAISRVSSRRAAMTRTTTATA